MGKIFSRILLYLFLTTAVASSSCTGLKRTKTKKSIETFDEKKEDHSEAELKAEEEGRKRHVKLQEKHVRRRMRKSARKAKRHRENKREPFFKRLFTKS